jgi:ABC-type sulfate/molybdate transport systems ATPase subunit
VVLRRIIDSGEPGRAALAAQIDQHKWHIGRSSGSGKTTLLRCDGGLEQPTAGTITIGDGKVFPSDIGYVFQEPR